LVGQTFPEGAAIAEQLKTLATITGRLAESELAALYADHDVFLFPTIEDGAPAVVVQAAAALLPIFCTPNCSWPEIHAAGALGQILPARAPEQFIQALQAFAAERHARASEIQAFHASGALQMQSALAPQIEQLYQALQARIAAA
jgi:glycosyltransferase involved in cell wall biosynthesis